MPTFLRKIYWFVVGFATKYKKIVLVSVVGAVALIGFVLVIWPKLPKLNKVRYVGIVGKYGLTQVPRRIEQELGMGLTILGENQVPEPGLSKRWEISNDGRTYRFYLRNDVLWSDGTPVTLADLNFSIPDVKIEKKEPDVLEFVLPEAFSPFPMLLTKPVLKDGKFTTGQFVVADIQADGPFLKQVNLKNDKENLIFRFYDSGSAAITAFKLSQIDEIVGLFDAGELSDWPNLKVEKEDQLDFYVALFYNNEDSLLRDKSVRQALSYAISDKNYGFRRASGPISPKSWAYNPVVKDYGFDQGRAKELLDKVLPPDNKKISLELSSTPDLLPIAEVIKKDWEKVGVKAEIKVVASIPSSFQVLLAAQETTADPDQYLLWHSTQASNFTNFRSPKVDKLLEDGRQTLKQADR